MNVENRAEISIGPDELQTFKVRLENIFSETDNKEQLIINLIYSSFNLIYSKIRRNY